LALPSFDTLREHARFLLKRSAAVLRGERRFDQFLRRVPDLPQRDGTPAVVVVTHWWGTAEPWCMMTLALLLHRYRGNTVVLFDDTNVNARDVGTHFELAAIARVLRHLPLTWHRLSDFDGESPLSAEEVAQAARADAIKGYRGEQWSAAQQAHASRVEEPLRRTAGRIHRFLAEHPARYLLVSTGYQATGGLYPRVAKLHGVRVATTDGNAGSRLLSVDGIAAHLPDVARTYELIGELEPWAEQFTRREWDKRWKGQDRYQYQVVAAAESADGPIGPLLPLNQSYDTSAMGRSQLFEGQDDWLMSTVAWLLEHTTETITIRQHPVERLWPGNDDYRARLHARFGDNPRIQLFDAWAQVNTYDLVRRAKVVLPHTSSVGMEAVAAGRPVVAETHSFYSAMGVVTPAPSREAYFAQIEQALAGRLDVSDDQKRRAIACWYLSQICSYVPTILTGYPEDFEQWHKETLESLGARPDVQMTLEAIETDTPLPLLRHRQLRTELNEQDVRPR
jgi:hypothetical protein